MIGSDDEGFLTYASLSAFLRSTLQLGDSYISKVFKDMNPSDTDYIDYSECFYIFFKL